MMKRQLVATIVLLLISCSSLLAQGKRTITGVITDANGKPVPGATVSVKGAVSAVMANEKGEFSITVSGNPDLEVSSVGYTSKTVKLGDGNNVSVSLAQPKGGDLEGVVVTAMGIKRQERSLGYATATVGSAELVKTAPTNFAGALYGKVPGLQVSSAPGGSTSGVVMQVRGANSINFNSTPLIVVDGIPIRDGGFNSGDYWGDGRVRGNGLIDLNPEDMESVTVLKGAAAGALYGSEGKNGVVVITTKKAKRKGFSIDVNASYFQDKVAYLPRFQNVRGAGFPVPYGVYGSDSAGFASATLNGTTYRTNIQGSLNFGPLFDGKPILSWDGVVRPYSAQPDRYENLFQVGHSATQNVAINNSTDKANIRFSMTHSNFEGISLNSKDEKFNANFNSTINLSNNFSIDVMINYINQHVHDRPFLVDRMINNFGGMMPVFDNGSWYKDKYQTSLGFKYVTGTNQSLTPDENLRYANRRTDILDYMWNVNKNMVDEYNNRLISGATANLKLAEGLAIRGKIATDYTFDRTQSKTAPNIPISFGPSGGYSQGTNNITRLYGDLLLMYEKKITNDLGVSVTGGYTARKETGITTYAGTSGGLTDYRYDINASFNKNWSAGTGQNYFITDALFGTIHLDYKGYLYVEGTGRRDRTSTMNPNNNSFFYPSVNAAFVLSEAVKLPEVINYAKLRGSWGVVGTYPEAYLANVAYMPGNLGQQSATGGPVLTTNTIANPYGNDNIRPEKKNEYEFGFEAGFLKSRLNLDVSYYSAKVYDLLLNLSLPQSMGASSILSNVGELSNKGVDIGITAKPILTNNFSWTLGLNYASNKNKIVKLANGSNELIHGDFDGNAYQIKSVVGQAMGDIYVHPTLVNDKGQAIITSDGLYQQDPNKMVSGGNSQVKGTGGLQNTFSYKNFSLSLNTDFRYGGYLIPTGIFWMNSRGITQESLNYMDAAHGGLTYYLDKNTGKGMPTTAAQGPHGEVVLHDGMLLPGVTADGQANTNIISQAYYYWNTYNWGGPQYSPNSLYNLYVVKNNYIKMREIAFTYNLPTKIVKKVWANRIAVSVFARNAFFIYRSIKDMDPEQTVTSNIWYKNLNNAGSQPATRSFGASIRASF